MRGDDLLTPQQLEAFHANGHVTVPSVLRRDEVADAIADVDSWSSEFLQQMREDQQEWFLEPASAHAQLRKLDNPVLHREIFRQLARKPQLVEIVEQVIGSGVSVFFSQMFMKPPEVGGPKPVHQDNFYFGPSDLNGTLTIWVALDDATEENGCLDYCDGSHNGPVIDHVAPPDAPFNLHVPPAAAAFLEMTPAPVPRGGVSIHHGNTLHQSSANRSQSSRRAVAIHYIRNDIRLVRPALDYDQAVTVRIT